MKHSFFARVYMEQGLELVNGGQRTLTLRQNAQKRCAKASLFVENRQNIAQNNKKNTHFCVFFFTFRNL